MGDGPPIERALGREAQPQLRASDPDIALGYPGTTSDEHERDAYVEAVTDLLDGLETSGQVVWLRHRHGAAVDLFCELCGDGEKLFARALREGAGVRDDVPSERDGVVGAGYVRSQPLPGD